MAQTIVSWCATITVTALAIWFVTLVWRVVVMRGRYKRIARSPIASWAPPDTDIDPVAFPALDNVADLSNDVNGNGVYVVDYDALGQRGVAGRQLNPANIAVFAIKCARNATKKRKSPGAEPPQPNPALE